MNTVMAMAGKRRPKRKARAYGVSIRPRKVVAALQAPYSYRSGDCSGRPRLYVGRFFDGSDTFA